MEGPIDAKVSVDIRPAISLDSKHLGRDYRNLDIDEFWIYKSVSENEIPKLVKLENLLVIKAFEFEELFEEYKEQYNSLQAEYKKVEYLLKKKASGSYTKKADFNNKKRKLEASKPRK